MCAKSKSDPKNMPTDYCTIACNTNGYSKDSPLVEVAAVRVESCRAVAAFRSFIACERQLIENVKTNGGITEAHLKGAPPLDEAMTGLLDFIGDLPLVGAKYGRFIKPYIERDALEACGVVMENKWRDVLWKADGMGLLSRDSLTDLCEHLKIRKDAKHRALTDAVATWQCWEAMRLIDEGAKVRDLPDWIYHGDIPVQSLGPDTDAEVERSTKEGLRMANRAKWVLLAAFFAFGASAYIKPAFLGEGIPYGRTAGEMLGMLVAFAALAVACLLRSLKFRPGKAKREEGGPISEA